MLSSVWSTYQFLRAHPLAQKRLTAALVRYVQWQLRARLLRGPHVFPWIGDARLVARLGQTAATGNWYAGLMEYQDMGFVLHYLRPDDLFLDVGANIGAFTVLAAKVCHTDVLAVEPGEHARKALSENLRVNEITNLVQVDPRGIGASAGKALFTTGHDTIDKIVSVANASTVEIEVTTIDLLSQQRCPACIKMDIEGAEYDAILGAEKTLANPALKVLIVELNDNVSQAGHEVGKLTDLIVCHGFQSCGYDPMNRVLTEQPLRGSDNVIFVRDRAGVEARLQSAPKVDIFGTLL